MSKIEWTEQTWNPVTGCTKVSQGCKNCYAENVAKRFWGDRKFTDIQCHKNRLDIPLKRKKPTMYFVNSMSDLFHEDVPFDFIDEAFSVMAATPRHSYQILTKRPERMMRYAKRVAKSKPHDDVNMAVFDLVNATNGGFMKWPLKNVWLGVSVENQETADERIPFLLKTPAAVRWLSMEPLLDRVSFRWAKWHDYKTQSDRKESSWHLDGLKKIDWVVAGGESGNGARSSQAEWFRELRDQCVESNTPFFFKQWGEYGLNWLNDNDGNKIPDTERMDKMGKRIAGRVLDNKTWDQYPV